MGFKKGDTGVSILKNFNLMRDKDGNPSMFNNMWDFQIEFENGLIGKASSKTETGDAYTTGLEYTYEITYRSQYHTNLKGVSKYDPDKKQGGGNDNRRGYTKGGSVDPNKEYYILMSVAVESACITVKELTLNMNRPTELKPCIGTYTKWLLRKTYVEKCNAINVQAALRRAVLLVGIDKQDVDSPEKVTMKANELYKSINDNVEWQKKLVQEMLSKESGPNTQNPPQQNQSQPERGNQMTEMPDNEMA